jgi:hypothetical protein
MGRRTNPLGLRIKGMLNWTSSVRYPLLQEYIRHLFQKEIVGPVGVRSSTSGIWVNVTLLGGQGHPKFKETVIDWRSIENVNGMEGRVSRRCASLIRGDVYYKKVLSEQSMGLQMYKNVPIRMQINHIQNPLLDAQVMAHYVAGQLKGQRSLGLVYKRVLGSMF